MAFTPPFNFLITSLLIVDWLSLDLVYLRGLCNSFHHPFTLIPLTALKKEESSRGRCSNLVSSQILQSRQVKRTPQDSINESIFWKMNPLVVPVTGVKFNSAFCLRRELLCIWTDWKPLNGWNLHQIQGNWASRNFLTASRLNSRLITHARMQRSIWNVQVPTDSTFE